MPPAPGKVRKIVGGPLYELANIQKRVKQPGSINLWTAKCRRDAANLMLDTSDLSAMVCELLNSDYRDSEWCENGKGFWAACDAYILRRSEFVEQAGRHLNVMYFLKFAESKTGNLVLIVSCHTSS
jgi:hypothetical protein